VNDERRLKPRYAVAVPIDVEGVRGVTRNLSINGVIFALPVSLEVGREIRFSIYMRAGNCRLDCRGRVIRQRLTAESDYDTGASIDRFEMHFEESPARGTLAPPLT
jgi:hypothetical protein